VDPAVGAAFVEGLGRDPVFLAAQAVLGLKIALTVLIFDPQLSDAFALVKSATAHAASLILLALLAGVLLRHGRQVLMWSPLHAAVGILLAIYALASVFALDREMALFGTWRRYLGLTQMADNDLLYAAAALLLPTRRDLARLATVALATAGVVVLYMYGQKLGLDPVTYIEGPGIRPPGTFGQPDVAGAYVAIAGTTALGIALWVRRYQLRAGLIGLALACFVAAIFTNIRGGMIGFGFGWLAIVALVSLWPHPRRRTALVVLGAAAVVAVIGVTASPIGARFAVGTFFNDRSAQSRVDMWKTAVDLVARRPLLGAGPDNFAAGYPALRSEQSVFLNPGELQSSPHDWLLHVATSAGVLGLVAFVALLGIAVVFAVRLVRADHPAGLALVPLAAFFGQGLVNINDMGIDWIPWLCIGVIAGASGTRIAGRRRASVPVPWLPIAVGVVALAVGVAGISAARDRIAASGHYGLSQSLADANRGAEAFPEASAAVQLDPRRAEYWSGLGVALSASDKPIAAAAAFAEAGRLKPSDPTFWRNLALMRLFAQDTRGALVALARATAADPWDPPSHDLASRVALLLNDPAKAAREGHLAVELNPTDPTVYEAPVLADLSLGKLAEAEDLLRHGLTIIPAPPSLQLHLLLAQVLHAEKRDADARAEIAAALAIDPQDKNALKLQQDYK
jgi:O-antigen ligase/Flp pilus assembly protein TadD